MKKATYKVLLAITSLTIIGEIASIILWALNPTLPSGLTMRFSLAVDYTIAVGNAAIMIIFNSLSLFLIKRKNKKGCLLLILISIINRVVSHFIFIGGAHLFGVAWTAVLILFAYLEYKRLSVRD